MTKPWVVIGGGLAGLSVAYSLSKITSHKIILFEAETLGSAATNKAAGLLTPATEVQLKDDPHVSLVLEALSDYPRFVDELTLNQPERVDFCRWGNLLCAFEPDGERDLLRSVDFKRSLGIEITELNQNQLQTKEKYLSQQITKCFWAPHEAAVNPVALVDELKKAFLSKPNTAIYENQSVVDVTLKNNGVKRVQLNSSEWLEVDQMVLATGLSHGIKTLEEALTLPLRAIKGEALSATLPKGYLKHPLQIYHRYPVYLCPRTNGDIVIGATSEEKSDTFNTCGALLDLLYAAWQALPVLAEHRFNRAWAGLRPTTPDNYPICSATSVSNLFCLTGLYRKGILLAPFLGNELAKLMTGADTHPSLRLLKHDRFST